MHNNDAVFEYLFEKAGGLTKQLDEGDIQKILAQNRNYLSAKYQALADEITAKFRAKRFEPLTNKLSTPLVLQTGVSEYKFNDYKVLRDTLLVDFCVPYSESLTTALKSNILIAPYEVHAVAYLTIVTRDNRNIVMQEPLLDYMRDMAYWPGKGKFEAVDIDWDTTKIEFPTTAAINALITANDGKCLQPVIEYIDMKGYPFVKG